MSLPTFGQIIHFVLGVCNCLTTSLAEILPSPIAHNTNSMCGVPLRNGFSVSIRHWQPPKMSPEILSRTNNQRLDRSLLWSSQVRSFENGIAAWPSGGFFPKTGKNLSGGTNHSNPLLPGSHLLFCQSPFIE